VQFELNGVNVGNPVTLTNGQATLTTPVNGNTGSNNLTAFYQGDATYTESVSSSLPITISNFALSSPGVAAPLGSAAIAPVKLDVATNYTSLIALSCTMPSSLTESACFIDPKSTTGTGQVSLTINTTPAHPQSSRQMAVTTISRWFAAGGASLACVFLLASPRRRWRGKAMISLTFLAILFSVIGCGGTAKIDPGTPKGTYNVVVTGTAGSGSSLSQTSVNVPITIQ
jgi:Bacterial Ig-like domain (group 3)